jgi:hypothetical protein
VTPGNYQAPASVEAPPSVKPVEKPRQATQQNYKKNMIPTFEHAVADQMKDPGSAKFRNTKVIIDEDGSDALCGDINAKNSYGGYTGFISFYAPLISLGKAYTAVVWLSEKVSYETVRKKCGYS